MAVYQGIAVLLHMGRGSSSGYNTVALFCCHAGLQASGKAAAGKGCWLIKRWLMKGKDPNNPHCKSPCSRWGGSGWGALK